MIITDSYSRIFKTLRVSLTNTCNLACTYCVNENADYKQVSKFENQILKTENLLEIIIKLHKILQFKTIRLTGGEPTLYKNIVPLIQQLSSLDVKIKLTTNGFLLKNLIDKLNINELDSINVSLDAMDEDIFFRISKRRSLYKILEGIEAAKSKNIHVKLNAVILKNINSSQILPLLEYSFSKNISIRFLELMKMGHIKDGNFDNFFSQKDILKVIKSKYEFKKILREDAATANYWQTKSGNTFGIIANESEPFCADCNRLRLDSSGNIFGCLSSNTPLDISQIYENDYLLEEKLNLAMAQKQVLKFTGSNLSMLEIGG
ncbi:MAG: radical SAM protein [Cytophagales bacterium]|nr:MAG: radical SAM protein [Cytophagales bacterium]